MTPLHRQGRPEPDEHSDDSVAPQALHERDQVPRIGGPIRHRDDSSQDEWFDHSPSEFDPQ